MAFEKRKFQSPRTTAPQSARLDAAARTTYADPDDADEAMEDAETAEVMSEDDMTELAQLRSENARLKAGRALNLKVSEKGALSVYGLGRFPVTLYKEQWLKLLAMVDAIKTFIKTNDKLLKNKGDK